jgi:hypothetical protein
VKDMPSKVYIQKKVLEEAYNRLGSCERVGAELKYSSSTICKYLKEYNIPMRTIENGRKYFIEDETFFSHDNEQSFYWAGFIAADGCVDGKTNLNITLSQKDHEHLLIFKDCLKTTYEVKLKSSIRKDLALDENEQPRVFLYSKLNIYSKIITNDLENRFNITPKKSQTITFPQWLMNHSMVHHFIRGYADGDGCFCIGGGRKLSQIQFYLLGSKEFLKTCQQIIDLNCNFIYDENRVKKGKGIFILKYEGNRNIAKITNFIYKDSTIFLKRKYEIAKIAEENTEKSKILQKESLKEYTVVDPNGTHIKIKNLKNFCKENNLLYANMLKVYAGKVSHHHKWTFV